MMKAITIAAILTLMFTGCSTTTPAVSEYAILPLYSTQNTLSTPVNLSLKLTPTKSIASLASKDIYYLRGTTQIGSYLYSRWADTPASMIDRSLTSSLQNRHLFTALLPVTSSAYADVTLESDLHAFYHQFKSDGSSAGIIDITYRLIESKSKKTIASKRFVITAPSPSANAEGGVNALSAATQQLSKESTLWLEIIAKDNQ